MRRFFGIIAALGALAMAAVATDAFAQSKSKANQGYDLQQQPNGWTTAAGGKSLQWDGKGRWGLKLDYQQPTTREVQWEDVNVGAYFKPNPRLRVGAAVNLANGQPAEATHVVTQDEKPQPRVRLETLFRF